MTARTYTSGFCATGNPVTSHARCPEHFADGFVCHCSCHAEVAMAEVPPMTETGTATVTGATHHHHYEVAVGNGDEGPIGIYCTDPDCGAVWVVMPE